VPLVDGYSTGAGSCAGNGAPVAGKHLSRLQITSGTLEAYDINITLGNNILKTDVPVEFESGRPHFLTLSSSGNAPFLGFLVRLSSPDGIDTTVALTPFENDKKTQVATDTCINIEGVGGLTHTNNDPKTFSQSILQIDEAAQGLILDVTVVVANAGFFSDFYYSQYTLNAVTSAPAPSPQEQEQITRPTTPDFSVTVPTTADVVYPAKKEDTVPPAKKTEGAPVATLDLAPINAPAATPTGASPNAAPVSLPFSAPAAAPTATIAGAQNSDASSGASSRHGTTGFAAYATLSLLVFTSFGFAS
jgi:hypothetical protein